MDHCMFWTESEKVLNIWISQEHSDFLCFSICLDVCLEMAPCRSMIQHLHTIIIVFFLFFFPIVENSMTGEWKAKNELALLLAEKYMKAALILYCTYKRYQSKCKRHTKKKTLSFSLFSPILHSRVSLDFNMISMS